jgi:hypothetical protein
LSSFAQRRTCFKQLPLPVLPIRVIGANPC